MEFRDILINISWVLLILCSLVFFIYLLFDAISLTIEELNIKRQILSEKKKQQEES